VLARAVLEFYQANGCKVALDSPVVTGVSERVCKLGMYLLRGDLKEER
jgi:hypothetical protein